MAEHTGKPAIRFAGFTDAWEQRKLGELAEKTYGGGTPSTSNPNFWSGKTPWIQSSDLTEDNLFDVTPRKYISKLAINLSAAKIIPSDSIAIVIRVGVGKLALLPFQYSTSQDFLSMSGINIDKFFVSYSIYKKIKKDLSLVQGTSIKGITKEELLGKILLIPTNRSEQSRIGTFFCHLDRLITLHQRKIALLQNIKKAMLEKMFPHHGADVPEVRFAGFTEAWEQRKFADLAETRRGLTYKSTDIVNNGIRVLRSSNIDENTFIYEDDDVFVSPNAINIPYVHNGDILITSANGSSRLVGKHAIIYNITENSAVHGGFMLIASARNPEFLNASMSSSWYITFINLFVSGGNGAIGNLNKKDLDDQILWCPCVDEQSRIGTFFRHLDRLITLHQRKVALLHTIKKACLEKMFV